MNEMPDDEKRKFFARFEEMGVEQVRAMQFQWSGPLSAFAQAWVSKKDRETHLRNEASQSEQIDIARSAKDAAWAAAEAARVSASEARVANDLARIANKKARTANIIAAASTAIAIAAIVVSVIALRSHT